jgi:eukaryotic-like serine/threonine-protein kinase
MNDYASRAEQAAQDPVVRALLLREGISPAAPELRARLGSFDSLALLDTDGRIHAQWPPPESHVWTRSYAFRDYFQGARQLFRDGRTGAFLAPAFRSESHDRLEFAFSAPIRASDGAELGVLLATLRASSVFGAVRMADAAQGARITTALIGPRGRDRNSPVVDPRQSEFTFLVHPGLDRGDEYRLAAPVASLLRTGFRSGGVPGQQFSLRYDPPVRLPGFRDPIPGFDGDWLAAFAPVGTTGYVVLVETRAGGILESARGLARPFEIRAGVLLVVGLLAVGALALRARRRAAR